MEVGEESTERQELVEPVGLWGLWACGAVGVEPVELVHEDSLDWSFHAVLHGCRSLCGVSERKAFG